MIASHLLAAGLFVASILARPSVSSVSVPSNSSDVWLWYLTQFARVCEGGDCAYDMIFTADHHGPPEYKALFPFSCSIVVPGKAPPPRGYHTNFDNRKCRGTSGNERYKEKERLRDLIRVTGEYREFGYPPFFLEVFLITEPNHDQAYMTHLRPDPDNLSIPGEGHGGPLASNRSDLVRWDRGLGEGLSARGFAQMRDLGHCRAQDNGCWQVKNMGRYYNKDVKVTSIYFDIFLGDGKKAFCQVALLKSSPETSFASTPCNGDAPFTISWGYKADTDGAVMTICSPTTGQYAVFGWDGINGREALGDSEPMPIHNGPC